MVKLRISGSKDATDVFNKVLADLMRNSVLICITNNKEYMNADFTVRRYYDLDLLPLSSNIDEVQDNFVISARISGSKDEVMQVIEILKKLGVVYFVSDGTDKMKMKKRGSEYTAMISCMNKGSAAKKRLLMGDNKNIVMLK